MTWFKVDDGFYDHPKFLEVPNAAVGLWVKAGAWCGRHLTDGLIPAAQIKLFKGTPAQVKALTSARIWVETQTENGSKAYRFNDWNEYQPTREQKLKERADAAERQRKKRERKRPEQQEPENVTRDSHVTGARDSHESHKGVSQRPDPTRPDPTLITTNVVIKESAPAEPEKPKKNSYSPEFETWWKIYPNSSGKAAAETAWKKALKLMDGEELNNLTRHYARLVEARIVNPDYVPHGSTWLNGRRWEDGVMQQEPTQIQATAPGRLSNAEVARQLQAKNAQDAFADTRSMTNAEALQAWMQEQKAIGF